MEETRKGEFNFMRRGGGVKGTWRDVGDWISTVVGGVKRIIVLVPEMRRGYRRWTISYSVPEMRRGGDVAGTWRRRGGANLIS